MSFKISSIGLNSGPMHARPALHLSHSTSRFEFFFFLSHRSEHFHVTIFLYGSDFYIGSSVPYL